MVSRSLFVALCLLWLEPIEGAEPWIAPLERMPLGANVSQLNRTNCVSLLLNAFLSNDVVKALIFMPGATDELYMFGRVKAGLTNSAPTLADAVWALNRQTRIRASFVAPFVLLHTDEDLLEPVIAIEHAPLAERLKRTRFVPHAIYDDRDWDSIQPVLRQTLKTDFQPAPHTMDSFHFYRHSFAAWNLTGWEALHALALSGKARVTLRRKPPLTWPRDEVFFECDRRTRTTPQP